MMQYRWWFAGAGLLGLDWGLKEWFAARGSVSYNSGVFLGWMPSEWWGFLLPVVLLYVGWLLFVSTERWVQIGFGLILVGGVSNWLDRLVYGAVRDYIRYPVVEITGNLADVYLTIGVFCVLVYGWRKGAAAHAD